MSPENYVPILEESRTHSNREIGVVLCWETRPQNPGRNLKEMLGS